MSKNNYDINFIELARITSDRFQYWSFVLLTFGEKGEISPQVIGKIQIETVYTQINDVLRDHRGQCVCARSHTHTDPLRTWTCQNVIDLCVQIFHFDLKSKMAAAFWLVGRERIFSIT